MIRFFVHHCVFLYLFFVTRFPVFTSAVKLSELKCPEKEKLALLNFKNELIDSFGRLSTWDSEVGSDCCEWKGVRCGDDETDHVVALNLRGPEVDNFFLATPLRGKISPSLLELVDLSYLDLSNNDFGTVQIPEFMGSLGKLRHLNLSHSNFVGTIPSHIGNLSMLQVLDLSGNEEIEVGNVDWLSGLHSLQHLDLSSVNLYSVTTWLHAICKLKMLRRLMLHNCGIQESLQNSSFPSMNGYAPLTVLDLSSNSIDNISLLWFLNHSTSFNFIDFSFNSIVGRIPDALWSLKYLSYLDLSFNSFVGMIPDAFGDIKSLNYLDLSGNKLEGRIPDALGNMMSLVHLDLSGNMLEADIPSSLGKMASLTRLDLAGNKLQGIPRTSGNLSGLTSLDLSGNKLEGQLSLMAKFLWNSTMLEHLDLSSNRLHGSIPLLSRFSSLITLSLWRNELNGSFIESRLILPHLVILDVSGNRLTGRLPDLASCSTLEVLNLSENMFNGTLTESIGYLYNLNSLGLNLNQLEGRVSQAHFFNMSQLKMVDLSYNLNLTVDISSRWNPPFQLGTIKLAHCKLGPNFPDWLQKQRRVAHLDISNSEIFDRVPGWFWDISHSFQYLNMSSNGMYGVIPNLSSNYSITVLDLSLNEFSGSLPLLPSAHMDIVDLSRNQFSGEANDFCNATYGWNILDLSNNHLSGELCEDCFKNLMIMDYLNLANNNLSGGIPTPTGWYCTLASLHLRNNRFTGTLPRFLSECNRLKVIDLGGNYFSGKIPTWIGESLPEAGVLSLRSNELRGGIPSNLCHLANMQILDLSMNKISGAIPRCLNNFSRMVSKPEIGEWNHFRYRLYLKAAPSMDDSTYITWKGHDMSYTTTLALVKVIDLSSNRLTGEIPPEITSLEGLIGFNVSKNNLVGSIPPDISRLEFLNFLDLSQNNLSGVIPDSLTRLSHMGLLNLSFNNLSGRIPWDDHLRTFGASAFTGNRNLCGLPLSRPCPDEEMPKTVDSVASPAKDVVGKNEFIGFGFYVSLALGFIVGFLGTFIINKARCNKKSKGL